MKSAHILPLLSVALSLTLLSACKPAQDFGPRPFLGSETASVVIKEFSDLQCPACAAISPQVEKLVRENPTLAKFEYYHFPLPQHQFAFKAAEASECAADQGQFFEYIAAAFEHQQELTDEGLKQRATELGLDQEAFDTCLDSGVKKDKVKADLYEGRQLQVNSTPSLFVNGQLVRWSNAEEFEGYLRSLQ